MHFQYLNTLYNNNTRSLVRYFVIIINLDILSSPSTKLLSTNAQVIAIGYSSKEKILFTVLVILYCTVLVILVLYCVSNIDTV